jgi:hypothetical protein
VPAESPENDLFELCCGLLPHSWKDVGVDAKGEGNTRVSEQLGDDLGMQSFGHENRGAGMAQVI